MKKILATVLYICMVLSFQIIGFAAENSVFTDVDANSSVGKDIYKLYNAGIVNGNGDGTFTPNNPVTRAELCKMVNNIRSYKDVSSVGFTDVTQDKWYYTHVLIGKQAGYINGFPDGTFRGDDYITREQVCAIVFRAFGIYDLNMNVDIKDNVSDWALTYVNAVISNKLMSLEAGDTFRATEYMKRGELSTLLAKFVADKDDTVVTPPSENTGSTGGSTGGNRPSGGNNGSTGGNKPSGGNSGGGNGTTTPDSGTTTPDSGTTTPDSGTTTPDSGTTTPDSGEQKPDEPMTKEEIIEANQEVLKYLKDVKNDLQGVKFRGELKTIVTIVTECVSDAIAVGESGTEIISKSYVYDEYEDRISEAKSIYYSLPEETQASFIDTISNKVSKETQDYLMEVFL